MSRILSASLIASLVFAAGAAQAATAGTDRMLNGKSMHGEVVAATPAARVVNVDAGKAINVNCGDVVTFQSAGKNFTWKFSSAAHRPVSLSDIAPAGFSEKSLKVYISPNDSERG